jgi:hypothetical protein
MAKSKNGGSRAYIRGRIGSDVYSVGKNGSGEKQQVVRSLAEQVANPRSQSQMFGRMVMSTVMQAVSAMTQIIDHSFDGYPAGQPSISQFIKNNYANVKADALAHAASGNYFGLNKFQEKGPKDGKWLISDGNLALPSALSVSNGIMKIGLTAGTLTVGGLKAALGLSADGYITLCGIDVTEAKFVFVRIQLTTTLADATAISGSNVGSLFTVTGNVSAAVTLSTNDIVITPDQDYTLTSTGIIVSEKIDGAWKHNRCEMSTTSNRAWASNDALPTYPTGAQMFLNGGDL